VSFVRQFYGRWQTLVHEVAKFGIVGAVCYVIDFGLFNVFHSGEGWGPITSKTLSTLIAASVNYFANRHWSFAHRARSGVRREYTLFIVLNFVGLAIALAFLGFGHYVLNQRSVLATNIWGNVIGTGMATFFRFWAYKKYVFLHHDHPKAETNRVAPAPVSRVQEVMGMMEIVEPPVEESVDVPSTQPKNVA
jgi:putative flippase GtrA